MVWLVACGSVTCSRSRQPASDAEQDTLSPLRPVRVLIGSRLQRFRFRAEKPVSIGDDQRNTLGTCPAGEWLDVEATAPNEIRVGDNSFLADRLELVPDGNIPILVSFVHEDGWSDDIAYPGRLHVSITQDQQIDLVNRVGVERYVACVVAREVWPTFETEAFRAQAIVVRTYVLYQMRHRQDQAYDVTATQRSQVYQGIRSDETGRRAAQAAKYTAGIVSTWRNQGEDQLFSAYYSAACGGASQSAAIFGPDNDIPPLQGGVRCDYCKIATSGTYRWGPVRLSLDEVFTRLIARYPEIESLGGIAAIDVIERTPHDRPLRLRIKGPNGSAHDLLAEHFRLAVGSMLIRSTDFDIRISAREVIFDNGRGFGHGLGLCQWGMQGQARIGKRAGEILRYYYPGCRLTRVY